jgi:hypothetical protein
MSLYNAYTPDTFAQKQQQAAQIATPPSTLEDSAALLRTEVHKIRKAIAYRQVMLARATARKEIKMVGQWRNEIVTYTAMLARFNAKRKAIVLELLEQRKARRFVDTMWEQANELRNGLNMLADITPEDEALLNEQLA